MKYVSFPWLLAEAALSIFKFLLSCYKIFEKNLTKKADYQKYRIISLPKKSL
jgi:hypothetical protein